MQKRKEVQNMKHKGIVRLIAGICCLALFLCNGMEVMMAHAEPAVTEETISEHQKQENLNLEEAVRIRTLDDFRALAENCRLDSWSVGKVVILENDLDFSGEDFTPIPTFGGVFFGDNHILKGIEIKGDNDFLGCFRYVQETGEIYDLAVDGIITTDSKQSGAGLFVGQNNGYLSNCRVNGTVSGSDNVGGLAGINEVKGILDSCYSAGSVTGSHMVGGLVGTNKGGIVSSNNGSAVNTSAQDNKIDIQTLTVRDLLSTENVASVTDIGGVTGRNEGVILSCVNNGDVGYQHVGYNVGGIAGSQTGFIKDSINYGELHGRKDVGGVAGQMEPSSEMEYQEDKLEKLRKEFPVLHDLVSQMDADASTASSELTSQIDRLLNSVEGAQHAVESIADDLSNDYGNLANSLGLPELATPDPVSLDFVEKFPTPTVTATPTKTPLATPTETPTPTPTVTLTPVTGGGEGNGGSGGGQGSQEGARLPGISDPRTFDRVETETYELPVRMSEPGGGEGGVKTPTPTPTETPTPTATRTPWPLPTSGYDFPSYDIWDQIDKDAIEKEINDAQNDAYDNANRILRGAESELRSQADRTSVRIASARNSLSSNFSNIINDMRVLNSLLDDKNQILLDDFQKINDEVNVITNIITEDDTTDTDDIFSDISDEDTITDTEGKLFNCSNYGHIYGDLNLGGIAGSMSRENNLDPEDDLNLNNDTTTLNVKYKERIVVRECTNHGSVEGKKDCAGGIVGNMVLGSVMGCLNTGSVQSDKDNVGGIAGASTGTIRKSSAKCALSGNSKIGGIAGTGKTIIDCYSMIEIQTGEYDLGSIAGTTDTSEYIADSGEGTIENNYFVEGCPPGIDGISYSGKAEPKNYKEFIELPELPSVFRKIVLTFVAENVQVKQITLDYGGDFDEKELPNVPEKEGHSGAWADFNRKNITFDQTIEAVYTEYITSMEAQSEEKGMPKALVEGVFAPEDSFTLREIDAYPEDGETVAECFQAKLTTNYDGPYRFRYLPKEEITHPVIYFYEDGTWKEQKTSTDGSYVVFDADKSSFIFSCVEETKRPIPVWLIAGLSVLCIIIIVILVLGQKRKKKTRASS